MKLMRKQNLRKSTFFVRLFLSMYTCISIKNDNALQDTVFFFDNQKMQTRRTSVTTF